MPFLPEPYNWKNYGDMNVALWKKHQSTSYEISKRLLCDSHKQEMELIEGFSNEELFEAGVLLWTGTSVIGAYCVSATASHYISSIDQGVRKWILHKHSGATFHRNRYS
jgi:hypothetical protein